MNEDTEGLAAAPGPSPTGPGQRRRLGGFILATVALVLAFVRPLYHLARFALSSELYSHILLVPGISLYLVWLKRRALPPPGPPDRAQAAFFLLAGVAALGGYAVAGPHGTTWTREDSLAWTTLSFLLFFGGAAALFLGRPLVRALSFPLGFLVFIIPIPIFFMKGTDDFLQHGSAAVACGLFKVAGTPVFYHDLIFQLPGINLRVAPECSGLHSTLALFMTSLLAGDLFLQAGWKRAVLALAVVLLGLLRNGLRIFTIGELCVQIGPEMIDSYLHRHG
ncbi:MAG: archaeosortase/exosortase family protein, partial [Opitutaceae bacterium]